MMLRWKFRITISLFFAAMAAGVQAEQAFVHSAKAALFAEKSFASTTLLVLNKGEAVTVLARDTRWLEVEAQGQRGWVSILLVKSAPPSDTVSVIGSDQVELDGNARMRASAVATAGATRGLLEGQESNALEFDFVELQKIETFAIPAQDIIDFGRAVSEEN